MLDPGAKDASSLRDDCVDSGREKFLTAKVAKGNREGRQEILLRFEDLPAVGGPVLDVSMN